MEILEGKKIKLIGFECYEGTIDGTIIFRKDEIINHSHNKNFIIKLDKKILRKNNIYIEYLLLENRHFLYDAKIIKPFFVNCYCVYYYDPELSYDELKQNSVFEFICEVDG